MLQRRHSSATADELPHSKEGIVLKDSSAAPDRGRGPEASLHGLRLSNPRAASAEAEDMKEEQKVSRASAPGAARTASRKLFAQALITAARRNPGNLPAGRARSASDVLFYEDGTLTIVEND
jgi:hypothetical protein